MPPQTSEIAAKEGSFRTPPEPGKVVPGGHIYTEKRNIHFCSDVDEKSRAQLCHNLIAVDDVTIPIEVQPSTVGGAIFDVRAIVQTMRMCRSEIIVLGVGNAYSAGNIMIQGASPGYRYATKGTLFLLHPRPNFRALGRPRDALKNQFAVCEREMELINKPVSEKMKSMYKEHRDFIFSERTLTSQEAKDLKLIDEKL